jgi:hypothetical protein
VLVAVVVQKAENKKPLNPQNKHLLLVPRLLAKLTTLTKVVKVVKVVKAARVNKTYA